MKIASQNADTLTCSSKGCSAAARWEVRWNNPKLHTPDRRKIWLACDEHRQHLSDFLNRRGFLREVAPIPPADEDQEAGQL